MTRPCFLIIDPEFPASISTRKLVVETAKFNVITAYHPDEAVETLQRFPAVDAVVLDADMPGTTCAELIARLRAVRPIPIITVAPGRDADCPGSDHLVDSHDPGELIELLEHLYPRPQTAGAALDRKLHQMRRRPSSGEQDS